ncbi:hypothetical protein ABT304_08775 [Nocardioides sp. NPDC000445]|uniref:hypothetical protein n=1 Tax=Nocardioides sp. NPDC000445 TaxID=3154257 RepID=UPI00332A3F6C
MPDEVEPSDVGPIRMHLEPIGLICGGDGTPLRETWVDLSSRSQILYGLNGAGKTTVLDSLKHALLGKVGGGRLLTRLPFNDSDLGVQFADALSLILTGSHVLMLEQAIEMFLAAQRDTRELEFDRRISQARLGWDVPGSRFDDLDWSGLLEAISQSDVWLFTPTAQGGSTWSVAPVTLIEGSSRWSEHLAELKLILGHEDGPLPGDVGLDLLWFEEPEGDAPVGIVGSLMERSTAAVAWNPWWPFGQVISDDPVDVARLTRSHLASGTRTRWGFGPSGIERGPVLDARVREIERRANLAVADLLMDSPALSLALGDDTAWFAGRSCTWSATRFEGDVPLPPGRLSWAEQRWMQIAVRLAIAHELNASFDRQTAEVMEDDWNPADAVESRATTWLILDEPERGLHRRAESWMASGIGRLTESGVRPILATHSPDLLDHGLGDVNYVRRRDQNRPGSVISMRDFAGVREDLGLNPSDLLRRTRGIALVEGEHDLEILRGMIGTELQRLGVEVLPLRGGRQLKTIVDSRFLYEFTDAVLFPVLDDLSLGPITELWDKVVAEARTRPASEVISDLKGALKEQLGKGSEFLEEFLTASVKNGTFDRVQPLGIPQSDILECLPVTDFVPGAESWQAVRSQAERNNGGVAPSETKFKEFLRKVHRANLAPEHLRFLAERCPVPPNVKALLAALDARISQQP